MTRERAWTALLAAARAAGGMLLALGAAALASGQQDSPDQQARRLLEEGRNYWVQGKSKQALENFNTIVTGFANTDSVDDALLEIGRYRLEVERDPDKARASFEQVTKQFPQSDSAPGAYYYLGLLTMNRAASLAELDDALAQFARLMTLYPRNDVWVPKALYASGLVQRKAGRLADALEAERRVSLEYPTSEAAAAAQFEVGHLLSLMEQPALAMEEFQSVRNRFSESSYAQPALERITALYRLHGSEKPVFAYDASFQAGAGDVLKDVRALLMTPAGVLWIASDKAKSAVAIEPGAKLGQSLGGEDLKSLSLSPRAELLVISRSAVRIGPKDVKSFAIPGDKGIPEPLEKLLAAVQTPGGGYLVSDEKKNRIYRFDSGFEFKGTFPEAKDQKNRTVTRMLLDGEGAIVCLDREEKTVRVYEESGKLVRSVGPTGLRKPVDAAVDPFRNTYVADEEGAVYLFSPAGQLLATIAGEELRKPKALTLDATGAILVYDERTQKVQRFR